MRPILPLIGLIALTSPAGHAALSSFQREDHLPLGEPRTGMLDIDDQAVEETGHLYDGWFFDADPGDEVTIDLVSDDFDAFLVLIHPSGAAYHNDDIGGELNSRTSGAMISTRAVATRWR
jgi:hypothetical protein